MVKIEEIPEKDGASSSGFVTEDEEDELDPFESDDELDVDPDDPDSSLVPYTSIEDETLYDRISALKDIIPPTTRRSISDGAKNVGGWVWWSGKTAGKVCWVVSTTALLIALPLALSIEGETVIVAQEREMEQRGQLNPQAGSPFAPPQGLVPGQNPEKQQQSSLVPPGF